MKKKGVIEKYRRDFDETGYAIEDCTCHECYPNDDDEVKCGYAFDLYNTNGDCLANK